MGAYVAQEAVGDVAVLLLLAQQHDCVAQDHHQHLVGFLRPGHQAHLVLVEHRLGRLDQDRLLWSANGSIFTQVSRPGFFCVLALVRTEVSSLEDDSIATWISARRWRLSIAPASWSMTASAASICALASVSATLRRQRVDVRFGAATC